MLEIFLCEFEPRIISHFEHFYIGWIQQFVTYKIPIEFVDSSNKFCPFTFIKLISLCKITFCQMPIFLSFYVFIFVIITMENMSRYFCNFYNLPNNENARAWVSLANLEWNNWVILMAINIQIVSHRCPYVPQ